MADREAFSRPVASTSESPDPGTNLGQEVTASLD
jgi:hypothetical protein